MTHIAGILLAGGASRRFGNKNKLTECTDGVPIAMRAASQMFAVLDDLLVVVPADQTSTVALFNGKFEFTVCEDARNGIGHSIAHGIGQRRSAAGWLIALADMPYIKTQTIAAIAVAIISPASIARPRFEGQAGHPVGFGADYVDELMALQGDVGAQAILNRHLDAIVFVDTDDVGVVTDIDRPADLKRPT